MCAAHATPAAIALEVERHPPVSDTTTNNMYVYIIPKQTTENQQNHHFQPTPTCHALRWRSKKAPSGVWWMRVDPTSLFFLAEEVTWC